MSFDVKAAKEGMLQLLRTFSGLEQVLDGSPESLPTTTVAYVTAGRPEIRMMATQAYRLDVQLLVTFGYFVAGQEEAAEDKLCDGLTELFDKVLRNRSENVTGNTITVTPMLNGSVTSMDPPEPVFGPDGYANFAGQEFRLHPIAVRVSQDAAYG
jgi:hypothetical protein